MLNDFFVCMFYFQLPFMPVLAYLLYKKNKTGFLFLSIFNFYKIIETIWMFFNTPFSDILDNPPSYLYFKFLVLEIHKYYLIYRFIIFCLGIFLIIFYSKIFSVNKSIQKKSSELFKEIFINTILILVILIEISFILV